MFSVVCEGWFEAVDIFIADGDVKRGDEVAEDERRIVAVPVGVEDTVGTVVAVSGVIIVGVVSKGCKVLVIVTSE